jgi:hypothetical protein
MQLHLLQAAAKLLPHLNHLQSHCKDDQLHVAVAVLHDTAVVAAALFAATSAESVLLVVVAAVAVAELWVLVSKHHITNNSSQWLKSY